MAPSSPIEVAVHPDPALRAPEPAAAQTVADAEAACEVAECSSPAPAAPRARHTRARSARRAAGLLSTEQQRELDGLLELLKCPVRQRILFALAANDAGATDGSGAVRVGG